MPRVIPAEAPRSVATTSIFSEGTAVPRTVHVLAVVVSREVGRIPWARITLRDGSAAEEGFAASDGEAFAPGKEIEIKSGYRGEETTIFKGKVTRHAVRLRRDGAVLEVEARHRAFAMTLAARSRYFADVSDADAIENILAEYNISADVASTPVTHPSLVQHAATDWDFLMLRAEACGLIVTASDDGSLKVQPPDLSGTATLTVQHGATLHEFDAEMDARFQPGALKASGWNPGDEAVDSVDASEPSLGDSGNISASDLANTHSQSGALAAAGHLSTPELQAWVDGQLLRQRLGRIRGRLRTDGTADVQPGGYIDIAGVGERFEGAHFVSGVRQQVENGLWETLVQFGLDPEPFANAFEVAPPAAAGLLPPASGLRIGVVTDLEDPEAAGRIRVRMPVVDAADDGTWARAATPDAGASRGMVFRPEIGDEVVIAFLDDDPRHPVILGGLFNAGQKTVPIAASNDNHIKGYTSRAGHKLEFNDESGSETITLSTPAGQSLTIKDADKAIEILDANGHSIKLETSGITVATSAGNTIKLADSPPGIELTDANGNSIKLEASGITIAAAAKLTLQGGQVEVSGGMMAVNAGMAQFSGVVQSQTLISTSIVGSSYTPGAGNLM